MKYHPTKTLKLLNSSKLLLLVIFSLAFANVSTAQSSIKITITPNQSGLITPIIQKAIDSCAANGGGIVFFPAGNFKTGTIQLKSKVLILTVKGTIIYGSNQYADYKNDALIFGENLTDIAILGEGTIDGVDCKNPEGEEGFRGAHCIRFVNCNNITFKDFTIKNSANWAFNLRNCSNATVQKINIRGGHDGLHTRFCNNFTVSDCDFRTGDDAFAGNDNKNFTVTNCKINTSCNGFRMGCYNFTVKKCFLYGPGEYAHKSANRTNMLAAFVHFSPSEEEPKLKSGNWLIEDVSVNNVDNFYRYNYKNGLWQTGRPATNIKLNNVKATNLLGAFNIIGDSLRNFNLSISNSLFSFRKGAVLSAKSFEDVKIESQDFFYANRFNQIKMENVVFNKNGASPILNCKFGNSIVLIKTALNTGLSAKPYLIKAVEKVSIIGKKTKTASKLKYH